MTTIPLFRLTIAMVFFFFRSQSFLLDHFSEDILRELQAMEMSRCPLNQLKEQSSEKEQ